jgi:general secretion pathway protein L
VGNSDLERQVAQIQSKLGSMKSLAGVYDDPIAYKTTGPAAVFILEDLAALLPDNTYLTSLQFSDGKIRLSGRTTDPASLILLLGQSHQFSSPKFFAASTRTDDGESNTFHIEAAVDPRARGMQ